jgi:uncharacterized membrane protein YidH (DUF202 family)
MGIQIKIIENNEFNQVINIAQKVIQSVTPFLYFMWLFNLGVFIVLVKLFSFIMALLLWYDLVRRIKRDGWTG